jgi:hypothetical protein
MKVKEHINCSILLAIYRNLLWKSGKFGPFLPWKTLCAWFKTIFFRSKIGKSLPIKWSLQVHIALWFVRIILMRIFWCKIFSVGIFGATHCHEWFALIPTLVILMQGIVRNDGFYSYYICKALGVVHWNFPKIWTQAQFVHGMEWGHHCGDSPLFKASYPTLEFFLSLQNESSRRWAIRNFCHYKMTHQEGKTIRNFLSLPWLIKKVGNKKETSWSCLLALPCKAEILCWESL